MMIVKILQAMTLATIAVGGPSGNFQSISIDDRQVDVWIPECAEVGAPMILSLHAWATNRNTQKKVDRFPEYAREECALIVYPQGKARGELFGMAGFSWNAGGCCPNANKHHVDDLSFLSNVISKVAQEFGGDEHTVMAVGVSNGGMMANRLACSDVRVKALVSVSGPLMNGTATDSNSEVFACPRSLPVLHFHGDRDTVVPFWGCNESSGGLPGMSCKFMARLPGFPPLPWPSVPQAVAEWTKRNGMDANELSRASFSNGSTACESWGVGSSNVTFCRVGGEGHAWPGICSAAARLPGMHCSLDIDASFHAMEFLRRYMRREVAV